MSVYAGSRVAGAQWLAGGAAWPCLLQSLAPPLCPPHKSPPLDHCCSAFGPNVDRPLRSTACLPQMLPAQGDPAAAAPFMTNTRILCFLHKFPGAGCQLSQRWRFLSNLSPGFSCDFKAFDGSERSLATWIMLHGNTGRAAHRTDRCFRQGDNTQLVNKAAVYILYTPLA